MAAASVAPPLSMARRGHSSSSNSPMVTKGNVVAQFLVVSALACVAFQFVTTSDRTAFPSSAPGSTSGSSSSRAPLSSDDKRNYSSRSVQFGSSECTCFLACLGLFGLIRRKKKEQLEKAAADDEAALESVRRQIKNQSGQQAFSPASPMQESARKAPPAIDTQPEMDSKQNTLALEQEDAMIALPSEVSHELLLFLNPRDLVSGAQVSKQWSALMGDGAEKLWKLCFLRDFHESGERFRVVFPIDCWRQYYFQHHLSRAVEIARLLGIEQGLKCVVVEHKVYDVTAFIDSHPGGSHVIADAIGTDATEIWGEFQHSHEAQESMTQYVVYDGILCDPKRVVMRGNLAKVVKRWHRISWCLSNAHCFGSLAATFADVMVRFHTHGLQSPLTMRRSGSASP